MLTVSLQNIPEKEARNIIEKVNFSQTKVEYEQAITALVGYKDVDKSKYFSALASRIFSA